MRGGDAASEHSAGKQRRPALIIVSAAGTVCKQTQREEYLTREASRSLCDFRKSLTFGRFRRLHSSEDSSAHHCGSRGGVRGGVSGTQ